jgi:hypothetical protein
MNSLPRVAMLSMWRDDTQRNLRWRALHLLTRSYPALRWVWVVGDTHDDTYRQLLAILNEVRPFRQVDLLQIDTGIVGDDPPTRRKRLGATANVWLDMIKDTDEYLLVHESDIISPVDLVERFLDHAAVGRCPIAGWPILPISETQAVFYDIWAYRKDGQMFTNMPPFHACYKPDEPFEVDSVGTAWLLAAEDVRKGARFGDEACLTLCAELRAMGRRFWVDPKLIVVQPRELWVAHSTA